MVERRVMWYLELSASGDLHLWLVMFGGLADAGPSATPDLLISRFSHHPSLTFHASSSHLSESFFHRAIISRIPNPGKREWENGEA
jgi:hypothetical protein